MKRAIKTVLTLFICISILFALTSCSFGFIGNLFGGLFSGGGNSNKNISQFKISVGEVFAYDDDGVRINFNNEFVSRGNNTYYVVNNYIVYNLFIIDGYVYDFGDDGLMVRNQTHNGYVFDDDGRLVGNNIFVIVNGVTYFIVNNVAAHNLGIDGENGDADNDGLSNKDELANNTDLFVFDTDGDGASDGSEVATGFDPLAPNASFEVSKAPIVDNGEDPDTVIPTIQIQLSGDQMNSLVVERDDFFSESTLGYLGDAYNYSVDGDFGSATIGFEFDESKLGANSLPTIYAFDKETGMMVPLDTKIDGNTASAEVDQLSTYVILDRSVYEKELTWVDVWGLDNSTFTNIEIVFVIDDSGSMGPVGANNDPQNLRLSVSRNLIDQLPEGSKIGVVRFADSTQTLTQSLTTDKVATKNYLTTSYFRSSGGTYMYEAIKSSVGLFSPQEENDGIMRIMVVLSDGSPSSTSNMTNATNAVINAGISVYTVGLGNSTSAFNSHLKPLSDSTGGKLYLTSNASGLADIFSDIGEKIDLTTDTDSDGLLDYYEDNMVIFDGLSYTSDKNNPDSDEDGLYDGEEIRTVTILSMDGKQMTILGRVYSDPSKPDTDGDGTNDKDDAFPLDANAA